MHIVSFCFIVSLTVILSVITSAKGKALGSPLMVDWAYEKSLFNLALWVPADITITCE